MIILHILSPSMSLYTGISFLPSIFVLSLFLSLCPYIHVSRPLSPSHSLPVQSCDNALTSTAASQCLDALGNFLGPNILRGRIEQYNPQ